MCVANSNQPNFIFKRKKSTFEKQAGTVQVPFYSNLLQKVGIENQAVSQYFTKNVNAWLNFLQ